MVDSQVLGDCLPEGQAARNNMNLQTLRHMKLPGTDCPDTEAEILRRTETLFRLAVAGWVIACLFIMLAILLHWG